MMLRTTLVRALLGWFCILAVAVVNGGVRDALVRPRLGSMPAEIYGALVLSLAAIGTALVVMRPGAAAHDWMAALQVSFFWVVLTLSFEFLFFHYVAGHSWDKLMSAYRFWEGRLWIVVVLTTAAAPFLAIKWRG